MKTFTTVKAKHGNLNHGHHDTGEPGAVISRTPGSEGGRRFARSSAELTGFRRELVGVRAYLGDCVLGFGVNSGGVVRRG